MTTTNPNPLPPTVAATVADWQTVRQLGHDLNNFIGVIGGYAEMLIEDAPEGSELVADLRRIQEAADRAATVVTTLRELARQGTDATPPSVGR